MSFAIAVATAGIEECDKFPANAIIVGHGVLPLL